MIEKKGSNFGVSITGKTEKLTNFLSHVFEVLTIAEVFFRKRKKVK